MPLNALDDITNHTEARGHAADKCVLHGMLVQMFLHNYSRCRWDIYNICVLHFVNSLSRIYSQYIGNSCSYQSWKIQWIISNMLNSQRLFPPFGCSLPLAHMSLRKDQNRTLL